MLRMMDEYYTTKASLFVLRFYDDIFKLNFIVKIHSNSNAFVIITFIKQTTSTMF